MTTSQVRARPGRRCRGHHTSALASLTIDLGLPASESMVVSPPMTEGIELVINGETRTVAQGTTVAALIGELGLGDRQVAVERTRAVVPRAAHASTVLAAGDRLEVVTVVGGG